MLTYTLYRSSKHSGKPRTVTIPNGAVAVIGKSGKVFDVYTGQHALACLSSLHAACFKRQASGLMVQIRKRPRFKLVDGVYVVPAAERLTCANAAKWL